MKIKKPQLYMSIVFYSIISIYMVSGLTQGNLKEVVGLEKTINLFWKFKTIFVDSGKQYTTKSMLNYWEMGDVRSFRWNLQDWRVRKRICR